MPINPTDPRVGAALNTNGTIADRTIRHALYLERLKTGEAKRVLGLLERHVFPDLERRFLSQLARMSAGGRPNDTGLFTTNRYREMMKSVATTVREGYGIAQRDHRESLLEIASAEVKWQGRVFEDTVPAVIKAEWEVPPLRLLRTVVNERPFEGKLLSEWFKDSSDNLMRRLNQQLRIGISTGESIPQLMGRLRGVRGRGGLFGKSRSEIEGIVRTAVAHVQNAAREEMFRANDDVVKGVQWISALDLRVCRICQAYADRVYALNEGPRPPVHLGDRCVMVAVLKSLREMGIPLDEVDAGTRASMNGEVAQNVTLASWIRTRPAEEQNRLLGRGIARRVRSGSITIDELNDATRARFGEPLTLTEVIAREAN